MNSTYSVTEAQTNLPRLLRDASHRSIAIRRHGDVVAYVVSRERMEAIIETLEILGNPEAMKAIRNYERGAIKFRPLSALNEAD
ncbi:MAG: type II toxin-antitoxin system Phd/YefM family antitoxin [Spartobacteria bacterium]